MGDYVKITEGGDGVPRVRVPERVLSVSLREGVPTTEGGKYVCVRVFRPLRMTGEDS